jgi:hypothetical protein
MPEAVPFPPIVPSSRRYIAGQYPESEFRALNGVVTHLRYGNRLTDTKIEATFQNIPDSRAAEVLALHRDTLKRGDWLRFTRSDMTGGASEELQAWLRDTDGSGLRWRFDRGNPPSVESVIPGRSTLTCQFVGELDPV